MKPSPTVNSKRLLLWMAANLAASSSVCLSAEPGSPLAKAHSHNDYVHQRPLDDAIDLGFTSIEADVWLVDGQLLVGHDRIDLRAGRTLEALYLQPLADRCRQRAGWVFEPGRTVTLLIDFKTEAQATYAELRPLLEKYRALFRATGADKAAPVVAVISGNRPIELVAAEKDALCGLDGRLADITSKLPPSVMPLISDSWPVHFRWRGDGPMPQGERDKLSQAANECHAAGRRLRFWATPENEAVWKELASAGVDHIGTDDLARLQKFLSSQAPR